MNPLVAIDRWLRGETFAGFLRRFDIDPRRYWLLMDLFRALSERREVMNQLGRDGMTLRVIAWLYAAITGIVGLVMLIGQPAPMSFLAVFMGITAFILLSVLLSETSNS